MFETGLNSDGEDGILVLGGKRVLQITMALNHDRVNWAQASAGTDTVSANVGDVAEWIDEAIRSKVSKSDPEKTFWPSMLTTWESWPTSRSHRAIKSDSEVLPHALVLLQCGS